MASHSQLHYTPYKLHFAITVIRAPDSFIYVPFVFSSATFLSMSSPSYSRWIWSERTAPRPWFLLRHNVGEGGHGKGRREGERTR
jgi:hypothetical protein